MDISFPPLEFYDPQTNEPSGFDVDLGKASTSLFGINNVGHLVGSRVGELIAEAQLIFNWDAEPDDVAALIHPHPTQSEIIGEAHLALAGKPLHFHA